MTLECIVLDKSVFKSIPGDAVTPVGFALYPLKPYGTVQMIQ